jgi:hypothetical protein
MFQFTTWQDVTVMVCQIVFIVGLIPTISGPHKPEVKTCLITAVAMMPFFVVYYSDQRWFALATTVIMDLGWWTLYIQSRRVKKREKSVADK